MTMTWNQFKEYVDKRLVEKGLTGESDIRFIDVNYPTASTLTIGCNDEGDEIFITD